MVDVFDFIEKNGEDVFLIIKDIENLEEEN